MDNIVDLTYSLIHIGAFSFQSMCLIDHKHVIIIFRHAVKDRGAAKQLLYIF